MEGNLALQVDSGIEKIRFYFDNTVCLLLMCFSVVMFNKNPTYFTIVLVCCIFVFLILSRPLINIYADKIEILSKSLLGFNTRSTIFYYDQIASIDTTFRLEYSRFLLGNFMIAIDPKWNIVGNSFTIQPKDGKKFSCVIDTSKRDLIKAFELVKKLSGNSFEIKDLYREYPLME
jgi:hypothetical protein